MKTKIYSLLIICAALLSSQRTNAQAHCGKIYIDTLFQFSMSTVTYSDTFNQQMDIYQPVGDTVTKRPLIVLAHGGSFVSGNREQDTTVDRLCRLYAMRGYVTASIDYRLASFTQIGDSSAIINEVIQALSDGKAAVRYFTKDAATANLYKIDTSKLFVGGNSAGAVMGMHYGYIDSVGEVPGYLQTIIMNNGGLEGNSGNAGYKSKVNAVINLAGGLNNPVWVGPGNVASVNAQGDQDATVPYVCADAVNGAVPVRLCGLGSIAPYYQQFGTLQVSHVFPGAGHVPWDANTADFLLIDTLIANFLTNNFVPSYNYCVSANGINTVDNDVMISLFPNPATSVVNVRTSVPVTTINVYDETGRQVIFMGNLNSQSNQINTSTLSKGVYVVKFETAGNVAPAVKRIVIE